MVTPPTNYIRPPEECYINMIVFRAKKHEACILEKRKKTRYVAVGRKLPLSRRHTVIK